MLFLRSFIVAVIIDITLAMLLFWVLPDSNVQMSLTFKIIILAIFPLWSLLTYIPRKRALSKEVVEPGQAMIGKSGVVIKKLDPRGTVRINYEVWDAVSMGETIEEGEGIVVQSLDGLTLTVQKEESP